MIYLGVEYGTKFTLEGPNGQTVVFNDSTSPNYVGDLDPESSGLDAPEIREDSNDRVESDGAIFGDFFSGKRPIVLQGRIIATSKAQRNERVGKLRAASLAKTTDATLWWEDPVAGKVFVNVRRQQPLRVTKGFVKEFQLALVAADSRILTYTPKTASAKGVTLGSQEKFPGTGTAQAPSPLFNQYKWENPGNVVSSNNAYATNTYTGTGPAVEQPILYGYNYGFSIPVNAVAVGVEVKPEHKAGAAEKVHVSTAFINRNIPNAEVVNADRLAQRGTKSLLVGPFTYLPTSDGTQTLGSSSDLWNYTTYLTPSVINSSTFGVGLGYIPPTGAITITTSVDALPVKVTYVEPLEVTVTNDGDAPAPATIKVKGPFDNFYVLNQTTGEILTYIAKVDSGKEIWFDTQNPTVTEHGTGITEPINRFANVGLPNDWIRIWPGANKIVVAGLGGNANSELAVEYRNAWE